MAEPIVPLVAEVDVELCRVKGEGGSLKGYRCEIVTENLSERERTIYKCLRCKGIMKDCSTSKRGAQMCACCLRVGEQSHSNAPIRNTILSLKCSCPLSKRGCVWLGKLGNVEYHLDVCQYVYVSCKLMCGVVLTRDEMRRHVREECPQRPKACLHCSGMHKVCEMAEHVEVCGKLEVMCELGCGTRVKREDTLYHRENECSEETVLCPYFKYRCEVVELKRRELKQHLEENRLLHTELKLNTLEKQTELKLNKLEKQTELKLNKLEEQTELKLNKLAEHVGFLENKLLLREKEMELLLKERTRHVGTVEWSIQHILKYFRPNQGNYFWESNFSRQLELVLFPFRLSHTTNATHFNIYFHPITPLYLKISNNHTFSWPIKVIISVRVICQMDIEQSQLYKSPIIEIKDAFSATTKKICSIPLSTDLKDFIRSGCLDLEVRVRIFKD